MRYYVQKVGNKQYLRVIESYRISGVKGTKTKILINFGEVSKLKEIYDDPIEHFRIEAEKFIEENKKKKLHLSFDINDDYALNSFDINDNTTIQENSIHIGNVYWSFLYHKLGLKETLKAIEKQYKIKYSLNDVFKFLVFNRINFANSKLEAFKKINLMGEKLNFNLKDLYRVNKILAYHSDEIIKTISKNINKLYKYDLRLTHYDLTNFYIYTDENDDKILAKKGYSKEHSHYPIVQLALLVDKYGMPLHYLLFPGNNNDLSTGKTFIKDLKNVHGVEKSIIVADAGVKSTENILAIKLSGNGYILKERIRKLSKELKSTFFNVAKPILQEMAENNPDLDYFYLPIKLDITREYIRDGKKYYKSIREKYIFQYSGKCDRKNKYKMEKEIEKATKILDNRNVEKILTKRKYADFIKKEIIISDSKTGEIIDDINVNTIYSIDENKIDEYSGYSIIFTDQHTLSDKEIIKAYREQYLIEHVFKLSKSDILTRPIRSSKDESIKSHFIVCYTAIVLLKIMQKLLKDKYSPEQIISSVSNLIYNQLDGNNKIL
ncbi:IS1634 family transposase, partial [Oceanivirga salmonicida]